MSLDTENYLDADFASVWHPYTRHSALNKETFPVIEKGEGAYLYDTGGNMYLDAISSWWCCNLGHSHPRLVKAIKEQAELLQHSILGNMSHPPAIELASRICGLFPKSERRVVFASDGACAVEAALKISVQYWYNCSKSQKRKFVSFENAYHGDTLGAVSVGYMPSFHEPFSEMVFSGYRAETPCCGMCKYGKDPDDCSLDCFQSMESIIEEHNDELAAVIVESLCQGAAGMRMYSPRYLSRLSECCRENDVLLIVDEIAMGFGRTGKMFAFEHAEIDPDLVCLGKGLSGGYLPISATVVQKGIYDTFADLPEDHTFYHGHTFAGNPIASAVSVETLKIYEEEAIVQKAEQSGRIMAAEMADIEEFDFVANVRCLGMIGAIEFCDSNDSTGIQIAQEVRNALLKQGVLIRPLGAVIYLMLPLNVSEDLIRDTINHLRTAISSQNT